MSAHDRARKMSEVYGELKQLKKLCCSDYCSKCVDCKTIVLNAIYKMELMDKELAEDLLDKT